MSEYIIYWDGIGGQLTAMLNDHVPPYLWPKRIREERRREKIVRCRDCTNYAKDELGSYCTLLDFEDVKSMDDMFCAWGERKQNV